MTEFNTLSDERLKWAIERQVEGVPQRELAKELEVPRTSLGFAYSSPISTPYVFSLYEEAECLRYKPDLFDYDRESAPDRSLNDWEARLERAVNICVGCPLMVMCGRLATADERMWTVRGGLMPYRYQLDRRYA